MRHRLLMAPWPGRRNEQSMWLRNVTFALDVERFRELDKSQSLFEQPGIHQNRSPASIPIPYSRQTP
jgi:hypothetical protein